MSSPLASTHSVRELIPIDPGAARRSAEELRDLAAVIAQAERGLSEIETIDRWEGDAGQSFNTMMQRLPEIVDGAFDAMIAASEAMLVLARSVEEARLEAARAVEWWRSGEEQTGQWEAELRSDPDLASLPLTSLLADPGQPDRNHAEHILHRAQSQVRDALELAAVALTRLADDSPMPWSFGGGFLDDVGSFVGGVRDGVVGTYELFETFGPLRAALDPVGLAGDITQTARGVEHLVRNPGQIPEVVLDLELLRDDPARWLGRFTFDVVLTVPLGGSSILARTSGRVGSRATARLGPRGSKVLGKAKEIDDLLTRHGLPSVGAVLQLDARSVRWALLNSARQADRSDLSDADRRRLVLEHGGRPTDFVRRVGTVDVEGKTVAVEFTENTRVSDVERRVLDPKVVVGRLPEACTN